MTTSAFKKAGICFPVFVLSLCILFPLFPQESGETGVTGGSAEFEEEDSFEDDLLLMESEGITVTATPETTQQMKTLDKEDIARFQAQDLASLLHEALDLGITRYGPYGSQADINMRGFDSERVAFLIDGVPANSPQSGEFELSQIDLNSIERIEVIYGGSDTKYNVSGALGGVINIITVKKQKTGWRIGGVISNLSALPGAYYKPLAGNQDPAWQDLADTQHVALSLGHGDEKFSFAASVFANRAENHFLYRDYYGRKRRKESSEVRDAGSSASFVWELPDYSKFIVSGNIYYGDKNIPRSGTSEIPEKQEDFSTRQNILLDMPRAFRDDLATEASLSHTWQTLNHEVSKQDEHLYTAINRWSWYPLSQLTLRAGGDYRYITLDSGSMEHHDRHDGGVYLTGEYKPHTRFLIIPSVKAAFSNSLAVPVPKLGFVWDATDALTIRNNYFRSFKFPDFQDLYWTDAISKGDPDLKPEDGWGGDLGAAYRWENGVTLESTFFTQYTDNSIHWYTVNGTFKPTNVGGATFFGLDSKIRGAIPLSRGPFEKIGLSLSYQYMLSYLLSYGYTWDSDKRIPYMPAHTVGASVDIPWKTGSLLISGHFESARYAEIANLTEMDPYFLLNFTVNQEIGANLIAFGVVNNALNSSYESFNDYPMPGITVTLGVRVNFEIPGKSDK